MLLLMNVGNTNTQLADVDDCGLIRNIRYIRTQTLDPALIPVDNPIAVATVVPEIKASLPPENVFYVEGAQRCAGVDFSHVDVTTLGADRIANAISLAADCPLPAMVIDFGTAITFEAVDADRCFRGGAIMPGRKLLRRSLAQWTAQLPDLPWSDHAPDQIGVNTVSCMKLGIDRGVIGAVRETIAVIREQIGGNPALIAVGGDSPFFLKAMPELTAGSEDFTLRGIRLAYEQRQ